MQFLIREALGEQPSTGQLAMRTNEHANVVRKRVFYEIGKGEDVGIIRYYLQEWTNRRTRTARRWLLLARDSSVISVGRLGIIRRWENDFDIKFPKKRGSLCFLTFSYFCGTSRNNHKIFCNSSSCVNHLEDHGLSDAA